MNILYVNGHPYDKSFNAAIMNSYVNAIDKKKHAIETLELGKMSFDPVLRYGYSKIMDEDKDIKRSQSLIKWADHIVFSYPMWWAMMPSLLSGWIARVFVPGHSYHYTGMFTVDQLLKGKTADIIITARAPRFIWPFMNDGAKPLTRNLFFLTGIKKRKVITHDWMSLKPDTEKRRNAFLAKVQRIAGAL
jgi:putative NADPH-quinone reductase